MSRTFDLAQTPPTGVSNAQWWDEIESRKLRHVTNFSWPCERKPDIDKDLSGVEVLTSHTSRYSSDHLLWLDDCLVALFWGHGEISLLIASTERDFKDIEAKFRVLFPATEQGPEDKRVALKFWFNAPNGTAAGYTRLLDVPQWSDVEENYGGVIKEEMARLLDPKFRPSHGGQLMLWQGPPGTGKTFAIRALIREWNKWCDGAYIVDPDQFFNNANYMMQVMLDEGDNYIDDIEELLLPEENPAGDCEECVEAVEPKETDTAGFRWKLIILEDSGELLSADAKQRTGQALSRLLNIADGLIGQGLRVLVLITTNEEMDSLHEAISRPGRCASKIVFPRLSKEEANEWLKKRELAEVDSDKSLAELFGEAEHFSKKAEGKLPYQRELGFNVQKPEKSERRAIGFSTGNDTPSAAPEIGKPLEQDSSFTPSKEEE